MTSLDEHVEVVEAFLDGERVAPEALRDALAHAEARDVFIELLQLRDAVAEMGPTAWKHGAASRVTALRRRLVTAAAIALMSIGGYLVGQRASTPVVAAETVHAVVSFGSPPVAPAPTRVIALRPGVNWTESSGGR
jgi:hypothetical protein